MTTKLLRNIAFGVLVSTCYTAYASNQFTVNEFLIDSNSWDYAPSWMVDMDDGKEKLWWCSDELGGKPEFGDVIKYAERPIGAPSFSTPQTVLRGNYNVITQEYDHPGPDWQKNCTCDPTVIKGNFVNPDNGQSRAYIMYYTSAFNCATGNYIGVAWSNDGKNWEKYNHNPIISSQWLELNSDGGLVANPTRYGAGQAVAYYSGSGVWLFNTDTPPDNLVKQYIRHSDNGYQFENPMEVTSKGLSSPTNFASAGVAFDWDNLYWYVAQVNAAGNQIEIYKIHSTKLTDLNASWIPVKSTRIDPNIPRVNNPGFKRDKYGNITPFLSNIHVGYGSEDPNRPGIHQFWFMGQSHD